MDATAVISFVVHHDDDLVSFPILDINDLCPCGLQSPLSWDDSFAMHLLCNSFHPIPWRLRILFTILPCCTMRRLLSPVMVILLAQFWRSCNPNFILAHLCTMPSWSIRWFLLPQCSGSCLWTGFVPIAFLCACGPWLDDPFQQARFG